MQLTGYLHFVDEPWGWPLGVSRTIAPPAGYNVARADTTPLLALLGKLLRPLIPPRTRGDASPSVWSLAGIALRPSRRWRGAVCVDARRTQPNRRGVRGDAGVHASRIPPALGPHFSGSPRVSDVGAASRRHRTKRAPVSPPRQRMDPASDAGRIGPRVPPCDVRCALRRLGGDSALRSPPRRARRRCGNDRRLRRDVAWRPLRRWAPRGAVSTGRRTSVKRLSTQARSFSRASRSSIRSAV